MTIEEKVYALLSAAAVGVPSDRIKPVGDWQELPRPYIIHGPISVDPIQLHDGQAALKQWPSYQVSCFGDSWPQARGVANAVVAAIRGNRDGVQFFWRGMTPQYEPDVKVHHIALEFEVWEAL